MGRGGSVGSKVTVMRKHEVCLGKGGVSHMDGQMKSTGVGVKGGQGEPAKSLCRALWLGGWIGCDEPRKENGLPKASGGARRGQQSWVLKPALLVEQVWPRAGHPPSPGPSLLPPASLKVPCCSNFP